ncbi:hypothetical protein WS92_13530 [Burkholderia sp. MSMB1588]|nr:hypothetical protein WS92_13530 [Burkholderia sp. MSMB1588]
MSAPGARCKRVASRPTWSEKKARPQRRAQAGQFRVIGRFAARGERLAGSEYEGGRASAPIVLSDSA